MVAVNSPRRNETEQPIQQTEQQQLLACQRDYPLRHCTIDGIPWSYVEAGHGDNVIVWLPGALGTAHTAFRYILAFAPHYRVLSLDYPPPINQARQLLAQLSTLLNLLDAGSVHLVGGSYSGPVAHWFAQSYPAQVRSLILSNTGLPQRSRLALPMALITVMATCPPPLLERMLRSLLPWWLPSDDPTEQFWRDYFTAQLPSFTRQFLQNRARLLWELAGYTVDATAEHQSPWDGHVLAIEALRDPLFSAGERRRLYAHYPHAKQVKVAVNGHGSALKAFAEHVTAYEQFWKEQSTR